MSELRTSFVIDLAGNMQARARQYSQSLGRFARDGQRHMGALNRSAQMVGRGLDRLGNRYTALLTGGGLAVNIRQVGRFNDRLLALGTQAGKTDADLEQLKQRIFDVANSPDIRADTSELLAAIEVIQTKTGDLDFAVENIENIGRALTATGAAGESIGDVLARLQAAGINSPREVLEIIDGLNEQGKKGAFLLKDTAELGERVFAAFGGSRNITKETTKELGAVLQVIRQGTGSSQQAATAFEALIRTFENADKVKNIEALSGVSLFEDDGSGGKQLRSVIDIMKELVVAADGDKLKLSAAFPEAEAMRAFGALVTEFRRTGSVDSLDEFFNVAADGTGIMEDSARMANSFQGSINLLATAWQRFSDSNLAEPIQKFSEWLNSVDQETVQNWLKIAKWVAIAGGGLVVASKGIALIANARKAFGKSAGGGGLGGGGLMPTPVYIVNGPAAGAAAALGGKKGPGFLGRHGGKLMRGAGYAAAGMAAWETGQAIGSGIYNNAMAENSFGDFIGKSLARGMAALGSETARESLEQSARAREAMDGHLQISVSDDRIRVQRLESSGIDIDVDTGRMMGDS